MSVRIKVLIVISLTFMTLLGILYFTSQWFLLRDAGITEEKGTTRDVTRLLAALDNQIAAIDATAGDWAPWDDTYAFIRSGDTNYIDSNLVNEVFVNLNVELMLFIDNSGQIVFGKMVDHNNGTEIPIPESLYSEFKIGSRLLSHQGDSTDRMAGILVFPEGPMIIASQPIVTSQGEGPIRGTLIMGRRLDETEISNLSQTVQMSISAFPYNDDVLPDDVALARNSLVGLKSILVAPHSETVVMGYTLVNDVYGNPALILRVASPREAISQAKISIRFLGLALVAIGFVLALVTMSLLERLVILRLTNLNSNVMKIGSQGITSSRVEVGGNDEMSVLATSVNSMLDSLENSREKEREGEDRYRDLVENSQDLICTHDPQGNLLFVNEAGTKISGYSNQTLLRMNLRDILLPDGRDRFDAYLAEIQAKGQARGLMRIQTASGEIRILEFKNTLQTRALIAPIVRSMARDVTARVQAEGALRKSERSLKEAQIIARLGSYVVDVPAGRWKSSDVLDDLFGIDESYDRSVAGWAALIHPADRQRMVDYFTNEVIGARLHFDKEYRIMRQTDKAERWVHGLGELEIDAQNRVLKMVGTIQDITERKQAEEMLKASEERFQSAFEYAAIGMALVALDGHWIRVNRATCEMLGYSREEFLEKTFQDITYPDDLEADLAYVRRVLAGEIQTYQMEKRYFHKQGQLVWALLSVSLVRDKAGEPLHFISQIQDITVRKRAEEALRESEAELRALFASMQDTVLVIDRTGAYRTTAPTNPAFWYILPQDLVGKGLQDVFSAEQCEIFYKVMRQVLETQQTTQIEYELMVGSQSVWYAASISPMDMDRTLWVARDITERKRAEGEIRRRTEELVALYESSQALAGKISLDDVLKDITESALRLFGVTGVGLYLYDPAARMLEVKLATHSSIPVGTRLSLGEGLAGKVAQTRRSMRIDDYAAWEGRSSKYEGIPVRATLETPLIYQDELVGVLVIHEFGDNERKFTEADDRLLSLFAAQAAAAVQNARLFEDLRLRLAELEALHTVSNSLRTAQTQDEALPILLDQTLAALDSDSGAIRIYHPEGDEVRAAVARGWFSKLTQRAFKPGQGIAGTVFATGKTHLSPDFSRDPLAEPPGPGIIPPGWGGACVPIRSGPIIVGVLFVSVPPPRQITPEQVKLLESLAEMAGATLYRLRLLQEAQEQALRIQTIMDTTPTGMLMLDADGQILLANRVARGDLAVLTAGAQTDDRVDRLGNRPLADLLVPPSAAEMWHTVEAGTRTFEIIARPMANPPHAPCWVLAINDVTQIREQQHYQQAQERLATVGQLAAGIAHDFNNIMGAIALYAGMLRNSPGLSQRQRGQLDTIYDQAQHAANLIRQILDFSRRSVLEKSALDILPLVKEMVKLLERTLPESIRLELAYDRNEYVVNGDPTRLQQVLMNLALNARDAMPAGGQITFTCAALSLVPDQTPPLPDMVAGEWLRLSVIDTGTGIAPQHLSHIFEPFFTTKEPDKGTGLGLAQVYGIVKQHGGSLEVTSQVGQGSTFTLYLPLQHMTAPVQTLVAIADPLIGGSEGILVVEDNSAIRLSVVETLTELGYQVCSATNGIEALVILAKAGANAVDLLISDVVMPRMGGVDLAQTVRRDYPTIKILLMSGHPLEEGGEEFRRIGIETWIQKPFDITELASIARALLDQS